MTRSTVRLLLALALPLIGFGTIMPSAVSADRRFREIPRIVKPRLQVDIVNGQVRVEAEYVSIVQVIRELETKTGTPMHLDPGIWGLAVYISEKPRALPDLLMDLGAQYELVFTPLGKVDDQKGYRVSPNDPQTYFLTDEEFFRPFRTLFTLEKPEQGIETGRFFYDGALVPPPYALQIMRHAGKNDEAEIVLNGLILQRFDNPDVEEPEEPAESEVPEYARSPRQPLSSAEAQKYSFWLTQEALNRYNSWLKQFGREKAIKMLSQLLTRLPHVERFEFEENNALVTIRIAGVPTFFIMLTGPTRREKLSEEAYAARIQRELLVYERALARNLTVMVFADGLEIVQQPAEASALEALLDSMASSGFDRRVKLALLRRSFDLPGNDAVKLLARHLPLRAG